MRIDNQPYGRLNEIIYDQAFTVHPYKHPTIGSMRDLEAASVEDVRDFFHTYYVPANATVVIVGDFDTKEARRTGQPVSRPGAESRRVRSLVTFRASRRRRRSGGSRSRRTGRCRRSWSRTTSPSTAIPTPIRCTSRPRSCRMGRARGSTASWCMKNSWRWRRSAAATSSRIRICSTPSRSSSPGTRRTRRLPRSSPSSTGCADEPISAAELQQAKNQFARDYIFGRESNKDKASQLGHAVVIHDDIKTADGEFDIFMNITQADVQRVARKLLHGGEPADHDDPAQGRDGRGAGAVRRLATLCVLLLAVSAPARGQSDWPSERPPRPLPARDVSFPPYRMKTLPNGLQVIAVSHHEQPAVSLRLIVRAGGAQDPVARPGVAYVAAALLDQGTTTRTAEQIASTIDSIGGAHRHRGDERSDVDSCRGDEGQPRHGARSRLGPGPASGLRAGGNRSAAAADPVGPEGELRRSRLPRRRGLRPARLRLPSVRQARLGDAGVDRRGDAGGPAGLPHPLVRPQQCDPRHRRRRVGRRGVRRRRARLWRLDADGAPRGDAVGAPRADPAGRDCRSAGSGPDRDPRRQHRPAAPSQGLPRARHRHEDPRRGRGQPPAPRAALGARPDLWRLGRPACPQGHRQPRRRHRYPLGENRRGAPADCRRDLASSSASASNSAS